MRNIYATKQRNMLLNYISEIKKQFTVKDIFDYFNEEISLSTCYRLVRSLIREGLIKEINVLNGSICFCYTGKCKDKNQVYLKCNNCGSVNYLKEEYVEHLEKHFKKVHNFKIDENAIILSGICIKCEELSNENSR